MEVYIADVKELSVQHIDTRLKDDDDDTSYHIFTKEKLCMIRVDGNSKETKEDCNVSKLKLGYVKKHLICIGISRVSPNILYTVQAWSVNRIT